MNGSDASLSQESFIKPKRGSSEVLNENMSAHDMILSSSSNSEIVSSPSVILAARKWRMLQERSINRRMSTLRNDKRQQDVDLKKEVSELVARKLPLEMLAKDWFTDQKLPSDERIYLLEKLIPTLVLGLEKLIEQVKKRALVDSSDYSATFNPINFLAQFLMRNNPRYSNLSHTSPYTKTLKKLLEDLKRQAYSQEENHLAKLKAELRKRKEEREMIEKLNLLTQTGRVAALEEVFLEWTEDRKAVISLALVQNALVSYEDLVTNSSIQSEPPCSLSIAPKQIDTTSKMIGMKEYVEYVRRQVSVLEDKPFARFLKHMSNLAKEYRVSTELESVRTLLANLFIACDQNGFGFLDRQRVMRLLENIYDNNKDSTIRDTLRNPRRWPVVDIGEEEEAEDEDEDAAPIFAGTFTEENEPDAEKKEPERTTTPESLQANKSETMNKEETFILREEGEKTQETTNKKATTSQSEGEGQMIEPPNIEKTRLENDEEEQMTNNTNEGETRLENEAEQITGTANKDETHLETEGEKEMTEIAEKGENLLENKGEKRMPKTEEEETHLENEGEKQMIETADKGKTQLENEGEKRMAEAVEEETHLENEGEEQIIETSEKKETHLENEGEIQITEIAKKEESHLENEGEKRMAEAAEEETHLENEGEGQMTETADKEETRLGNKGEEQRENQPFDENGSREASEHKNLMSSDLEPSLENQALNATEINRTETNILIQSASDDNTAVQSDDKKEAGQENTFLSKGEDFDAIDAPLDANPKSYVGDQGLANGAKVKSINLGGGKHEKDMASRQALTIPKDIPPLSSEFEQEIRDIFAPRSRSGSALSVCLSRAQSITTGSAYDPHILNQVQFCNLIIKFLGESPQRATVELIVRYLRAGYAETEEEREERLAKARLEGLSARKRHKLDRLFELWDIDGAGSLELNDVECVLSKWKDDGKENYQKVLEKFGPNVERLGRRLFHKFIHEFTDKYSEEECFESLLAFLTTNVERSLEERKRGEIRQKLLLAIDMSAQTSGGLLDPVFRTVFQGLLKDSELHGRNKKINCHVTMVKQDEDPQKMDNEVHLRYVACTPDDTNCVLGKRLYRKMTNISFAAVDSGKPIHVPRVLANKGVHMWKPERKVEGIEGSFIVLPLKDSDKKVIGTLGIDSMDDPRPKVVFVTHEISFFQGVAKALSSAINLVTMKRKTVKIAECAVSWILRKSRDVHDVNIYLVEPSTRPTGGLVLRRMITIGHKSYKDFFKHPPLLERRDNLFRDYLFKCVDTSETLTADAYGERHLAFPLRGSTGIVAAIVDISIGSLKQLPSHEGKEIHRMLKLLAIAHKEITREIAGEGKNIVLQVEKEYVGSRINILFDRIMLQDLQDHVGRLDVRAFAEIRSYQDPPKVVHDVVKSVLRIYENACKTTEVLQETLDDWKACKQLMTNDLAVWISTFDPTADKSLVAKSQQLSAQLANVEYGNVAKHGSLPAQYLFNWAFVCVSLVEHAAQMRGTAPKALSVLSQETTSDSRNS